MARRRFFVDEVHSGLAEISGDDARHLTRVLRVEAGQQYEISDNRAVYLAEVETAHKEQVRFRVIEKIPPRTPAVRVELCAALIKFDHFEWMVEKSTELGVSAIIPFTAARSERGLDRAAEKRVERWRRIGLEASQQSRRDHLPEIAEPTDFRSLMNRAGDCRLMLDEDPGAAPIPRDGAITSTITIALGPEGGWTDGERAAFIEAGWRAVSLGNRILRAETAAMAALAILIR